MNWYIKCLQNYANFSGRASRTEYWMWFLITVLISVALLGVESVLGINQFLSGLYYLATVIPFLAVAFRRVHDTGKSGIWILINLIPVVGSIVWFIFMVQPSQPGGNQFGAPPIT